MTNVQEIFDRISGAKTRQKEIRDMYKDALATAPEYDEINNKMKTMRERKKQIEQSIRDQFGKEITELEDLKVDIDSDNELLSDAALSQLVKGETVEVKDKYENQYEPVFSVKFRKIK